MHADDLGEEDAFALADPPPAEGWRAFAPSRRCAPATWPRSARCSTPSHGSLRDLYEISVDEVERVVQRLKSAGAAGARIMGGGFGGSVLALFPPGADPPADAGAIDVAPGPAARPLAASG